MKQTPLTPEQTLAVMQISMMLLAVVSMWVVNDARTRGKDGWTAFWWGLGTLMALIVALPLWFIVRPKTKSGVANNDAFPREPIPNPRDAFAPEGSAPSSTRSKICDQCGKFYVGQYAHCPHCGAPISN
ncbi:MAG TPA: hypothetical protein VM821_05725 [Abditibacteriaceae bacterium]|jgi:hypothetical protein|nr:hypothetical protein [Abditibacteriaceae bacterium]